MKITALYEDKNNVLATAQVKGEDDGFHGYDLEASIQFVNGPHAVEFDFSAYCLVDSEGTAVAHERQRILTEIDAVNRLAAQVREFHEAFLQAANAGLDHLETLA